MQMTPAHLEELIQATLKDFWEVHQQEIDRRFDRQAGRIAELERNVVDVPEMNRRIVEGELATRRHIDQVLERLQRAIEGRINQVEREIDDLKSDLRSGRSI